MKRGVGLAIAGTVKREAVEKLAHDEAEGPAPSKSEMYAYVVGCVLRRVSLSVSRDGNALVKDCLQLYAPRPPGQWTPVIYRDVVVGDIWCDGWET